MTYWCVAGICVFLALVLLWGLKPGAPVRTTEREPLLATLRIGLAAGRMPRVALGYAAAFVSRADLAVVSQFLTLWLVREGMAQGMTVAQATLKATTFYVVIQLFALPWAVIFGIVLDRIDRLVGLAIGMSVAFVGYASLGVLDNPIGNGMYIAAAFVGAGEMAANISATSLIGKEAPERGRGAVLGLFSLFGAVGHHGGRPGRRLAVRQLETGGAVSVHGCIECDAVRDHAADHILYAQGGGHGLKIPQTEAGRWSCVQSAGVRASAT